MRFESGQTSAHTDESGTGRIRSRYERPKRLEHCGGQRGDRATYAEAFIFRDSINGHREFTFSLHHSTGSTVVVPMIGPRVQQIP